MGNKHNVQRRKHETKSGATSRFVVSLLSFGFVPDFCAADSDSYLAGAATARFGAPGFSGSLASFSGTTAKPFIWLNSPWAR